MVKFQFKAHENLTLRALYIECKHTHTRTHTHTVLSSISYGDTWRFSVVVGSCVTGSVWHATYIMCGDLKCPHKISRPHCYRTFLAFLLWGPRNVPTTKWGPHKCGKRNTCCNFAKCGYLLQEYNGINEHPIPFRTVPFRIRYIQQQLFLQHSSLLPIFFFFNVIFH